MKKIIIMLLLLLAGGCSSVRRDIAYSIIDADKIALNRCEIEGFSYKGIDYDFDNGKTLKILMIHGVGTHHPGYSRRIQENLAAGMGLDVLSRLPKNIGLLDPSDGRTPIGNLRITYWQNGEATKKMLFYELTWSEITAPDKEIIAFDTTEQYSKFRVPFNNTMKKFLDNTLPDPLVYEVDKNNLILDSAEQALCWMLKTDWQSLPVAGSAVCRMDKFEELRDFAEENLAFITHSLGSKILMDALIRTADRVSQIEKTAMGNPRCRRLVNKLQNRELTVYMLANQLPILQIGHPLPPVHNQIRSYCRPSGKNYGRRIFKGVNIVAFSDPNDILSYAIPQNFADKYIDSRICPRVTNVSVNVAPEISAFGIGVVNPVVAHTNYDRDEKVIGLITRGTWHFAQDKTLDGQCRFIRMEADADIK